MQVATAEFLQPPPLNRQQRPEDGSEGGYAQNPFNPCLEDSSAKTLRMLWKLP